LQKQRRPRRVAMRRSSSPNTGDLLDHTYISTH
jgi:hypothetical protein